MSMISSQCDERLDERLRRAAQTCRELGKHTTANMFLEAADTILELRDDLQRANEAVQDAEHDESMAWDRVSKAEAENVELRELVRKYGEYTSQDHCEGCFCKSRCNDGDVDECWQLMEVRRMARELGIETEAY